MFQNSEYFNSAKFWAETFSQELNNFLFIWNTIVKQETSSILIHIKSPIFFFHFLPLLHKFLKHFKRIILDLRSFEIWDWSIFKDYFRFEFWFYIKNSLFFSSFHHFFQDSLMNIFFNKKYLIHWVVFTKTSKLTKQWTEHHAYFDFFPKRTV